MDSRQSSFKRILVPLDGSLRAEQALRYLPRFTQPNTTLVLLRVLADGDSSSDGANQINESTRRLHEFALRNLGHEVDDLRASPNAPVIHVEVTDGDPTEQILHSVVEHTIDLIIMSSEGVGKCHHTGLGRVVRQVAARSPVPVFIVRNGVTEAGSVPEPVRRIVAPIDCSDRSARALTVAGDLAKQLAVPVVLVTALDLASCGSASLAREAAYDQDLYRELFAEVEMDAHRTLVRTGAQLAQQGIAATVQLQVGPIAETIMDATAPGDIVVMTSRGRGGGRQWPIGSVAEKLIEASPVPVLLLPTTAEPDFVVSVF